MGVLSREAILAANDREPVRVNVPEWGGDVLIRPLSGLQRDKIEAYFAENEDKSLAGLRARLVSMAVVDEDGKQLFSESDIVDLSAKNASPLDSLVGEIRRISKMGSNDVEAKKKD